MDEEQVKKIINGIIRSHTHNGLIATRVKFSDIDFYTEPINIASATIATTGNTDTYFLAPRNMSVISIDFSGTDALTKSDTNYITWTITNLGQDGAGTAAMLATSPAGINTTKSTGGSSIVANTKSTFTLTNTLNDLNVIEGDRIRIRAAVTNTLANTVTFPVYFIKLI